MKSGDEIARGWDLFRLGAFTEAEALLSTRSSDPAALHILLWIALRRGDANAKLAYGSLLSSCREVDLAAVGRAHQNVALTSLGSTPEPWIEAKSRWAKAEIAYARALIAFTRGEAGRVRDELQQMLPQTAEQRVRYAQLRSWIPGLGDGFERQAAHLTHALTLAIEHGVDRALIARIAVALAPLVRELDIPQIATRAEHLLGTIIWPRDPMPSEFYVQRTLAWRHALRGEWITALQLLDTAIGSAGDAMRKGIIFADRARISSVAGEIVGAASARESAFRSFFEVDWSRAQRDERMALLAAIDVLACDRSRARRLCEAAAAANMSLLVGAAHGSRMKAFSELASSHFTDGEEALAHAAKAYRLFKRMKYVHRAADSALRALELGGGARWRTRAERLLEAYPRSLGASRFRRLTAPIARLSGRMMDVAELLSTTGLTAREIGTKLGIAEGTVRVHIKRINKLLNTSNRSELVRYFRDNGSAA